MLVTIGITTVRRGCRVHRHVNGWAACGAGRLITDPRPIAAGDRLCRKCARHLHSTLLMEIDDMRRKRCVARAEMLDRFLDSGMSTAELAERESFLSRLGADLTLAWSQQTQPKRIRVDMSRYSDILV